MFGKLSFENQVNLAGGAVLVLIVGYVLTETVKSRDLPACQASYPPATQLSFLKSNGQPMSPPELQARIGVGERGVLERATVVREGPETYAMAVKAGLPQENAPAISFQWSPSGVGNAKAACLSYSVMLPRDFNLSQGGYLPGIVGDLINVPRGSSGAQTGFGSRPVWNESGAFYIETNTSDNTVAEGTAVPASQEFKMPLGRWFRVDQEVILNTPNAQDGQIRMWVDGKMVVNRSKLALRAHGGIRISGIGADVGYRTMRTNILPTRKPTEIKFTPPQFSWRTAEVAVSSK